MNNEQTMNQPVRHIISAGTISSTSVRNFADEDLGKIEDLMIDTREGTVAYAILSFGGFLGMGEKLFGVPWSALAFDREEEHYLLDVRKEELKDAPGFDRDNWPNLSDPTWGQQVRDHWAPSVTRANTHRGRPLA